MKLSSKTTTAIKMFVDLGEHYEEGFIALSDVALRKGVSKKFLEQIVPLYKNNGLLIGSRGNKGGYRLAKEPYQISLKDIVSVSESIFTNEITGYAPIDTIFVKIDKELEKYLAKTTLNSLVESAKESYSNDYCI